MPIRIESNRKYERFRHTTAESKFLASKGFQTVTSSNVSAVGKDKATLLVRFHGGATYGYPKSGSLFDSMLKSASKGKFVWRELIRKKVPYYKTTQQILKDDIESRDMMADEGVPVKAPSDIGLSILAGLALATMMSNNISNTALKASSIVDLNVARLINNTPIQQSGISAVR